MISKIITAILLRYPVLVMYIQEPTHYSDVNQFYAAGVFFGLVELVLVLTFLFHLVKKYDSDKLLIVTVLYSLIAVAGICFSLISALATPSPSITDDPLYHFNSTITTHQSEPKIIYENDLGATLTIDETKIGTDLTYEQIQKIDGIETLSLEKERQTVQTDADTTVDITYANKDAKDYAKFATYHVDKVTLATKTTTKKWFKAVDKTTTKVAKIYVTVKIDEKTINTRKELETLTK